MFVVNLSLAVFNLLPAFPLDGGRVFRALLAMRMPRSRASAIAVGVGRALALLMGVVGVLLGNILLVLIAVFVYFGAQAEGTTDQVDQTLGGLKVSQAVNTAVDLALSDQSLGPGRGPSLPHVPGGLPRGGPRRRAGGTADPGSVDREPGPPRRLLPRSRTPCAPTSPWSSLDETVHDAFMRMRTANCKAVPVVEHGRFVGMLSVEDISEVYTLLSATGPDFVRWVPASVEQAGPTTDDGEVVTWRAVLATTRASVPGRGPRGDTGPRVVG